MEKRDWGWGGGRYYSFPKKILSKMNRRNKNKKKKSHHPHIQTSRNILAKKNSCPLSIYLTKQKQKKAIIYAFIHMRN